MSSRGKNRMKIRMENRMTIQMKNWMYPSAQRNGDPLLMFLWCGTLSCVVVFPGSTDSQNLGRWAVSWTCGDWHMQSNPHNRRMFFQPFLTLLGTLGGLSGHLRAHKTDWPTVVTDTLGSGLTVSTLFSKHLSPLDSLEVSAVSVEGPSGIFRTLLP